MKGIVDRLSRFAFLAALAFGLCAYGIAVGRYGVFPHRYVVLAEEGLREVLLWSGYLQPWYVRQAPPLSSTKVRSSSRAYSGLNLVVRIAPGLVPAASVMTMDGRTLHEWNLDWFRLWPDAQHLPERFVPRRRPGTHVHGAVVLPDGDLVFNYEHLGLVRVDRAGQPVWRLPYQTHHSIHRHDDGTLWVCGQKDHATYDERFPNRIPPFAEYTILQVSPEGKILEEWSVGDILIENGLHGLLHLGSLGNASTQVRGDSLHLNDVEPFPTKLEPAFFQRGDVLVSLRNINTIFVFNRDDGRIRFICTGWFVRQHDPDFIDGNTFSVFDNNNVAPEHRGSSSRVVVVSAPDRSRRVVFEGNDRTHFFTDILGKHQWLPNGNLLLTESRSGRSIEVDDQGEVVWEYVNYIGPDQIGIVEEVQRLPRRLEGIFEGW